MLRKDVVALWNTINQIKNKEFKNFKFTYALAKNRKKIQPEIDILQEISKPSIAFQNYSSKRNELLEKLAKKDEKGEPIIERNMFIMENPDTSDAEIEKFNKENQKVIDENKAQEDEFHKMVEEEIDIDIHMVELKSVPKEGLTPAQLEILLFIVKE